MGSDRDCVSSEGNDLVMWPLENLVKLPFSHKGLAPARERNDAMMDGVVAVKPPDSMCAESK